MLKKLSAEVVHPGQKKVAYRPYSRHCPQAPVSGSSQVCGTYSVYTFLATDFSGNTVVVVQKVYDVPGVNIPTQTVPQYDPSKPHKDPQLVATGTCCTTVAN